MGWQRVRGHEALIEGFRRVVRRGRLAHAYLFMGPVGVGKTRFIMEIARKFEQAGLTVATGECLPIGVEGVEDGGPDVRATPLHPFRPLLQAVGDFCVEKGPAETARLLGTRARVLAECEPTLASLPGLADGPCSPADSERLDNPRRAALAVRVSIQAGRWVPLRPPRPPDSRRPRRRFAGNGRRGERDFPSATLGDQCPAQGVPSRSASTLIAAADRFQL